MVLLALLLVAALLVGLGRRALGAAAGPSAASTTPSTATTAPASAQPSASTSAQPSPSPTTAPAAASDGGAAPAEEPATDPAAEQGADAAADLPAADTAEMVHSGTVGDGTWTVAAPDGTPAPPAASTRTVAIRVENGIGIDATEASGEIMRTLADQRGWLAVDGVAFQQIADPEQADLVISLASPPTVDALCRPAKTRGTWNCRQGGDVMLNSDRWLHRTPTYSDTAEYRAYMVNHEVGHYLGHHHVDCPGAGRAAPVMLQQSMDLGGCRINAWPASDGAA